MCQATGDADDPNSRVVSATFSLPLIETSSSLGLCITCGKRDHVIALHSIVSLGMCSELVGKAVSCAGQFIGSAYNAVLLEAITKGYGVFLRTLTQSHAYEYGMAKGLQRLAAIQT